MPTRKSWTGRLGATKTLAMCEVKLESWRGREDLPGPTIKSEPAGWDKWGEGSERVIKATYSSWWFSCFGCINAKPAWERTTGYGTDLTALPRQGGRLAQDSLSLLHRARTGNRRKRWMFDSLLRPLSAAAFAVMAGMICHFVVCNVR
jgi:hypothetical protein